MLLYTALSPGGEGLGSECSLVHQAKRKEALFGKKKKKKNKKNKLWQSRPSCYPHLASASAYVPRQGSTGYWCGSSLREARLHRGRSARKAVSGLRRVGQPDLKSSGEPAKAWMESAEVE